MHYLHTRTVAELHGLLRERERPRDESLRRDDGGDRRQSDQRVLEHAGREKIEWIDRARRISQDQRTLPEVVSQQRRQYEKEPGKPDRPLAEMSHVRIERLGSSDGEDYGAKENEREMPVLEKKVQAVPRIRRGEDLWRLQNLAQAECANHHEPDDHHWTENSSDFRGTMLLEKEESREYSDRERDHEILRLWSYYFQAFHGAQHGDRGSDHAIAVEQRSTDQAKGD